MIRAPRRPLLALLGVLGALVIHGGAFAAGDDSGARMLERGRAAATKNDFDGTVRVSWKDGNEVRSRVVHVSVRDGVVRAGRTVVGSGRRRLLRTSTGWRLLWSDPARGRAPDPDAKYDLVVLDGEQVARRPTRLVVVRDGDIVRERLSFDAATGVLLRRDELDPAGHVTRRMTFERISAPVPARGSTVASLPQSGPANAPLWVDQVPDGLNGPQSVGDGFQRAGVYQQSNGDVQIYYADGVFGLSVFEHKGSLAWDELPAGGHDTQLGDRRARAYEFATGRALVWESDGVVYTLVSDAPPSEVAKVARDFGSQDHDDTLDQIGDFVTAPFSWD